ncbi:MAG TPA: thiamine pyrophosphate-binding protein [Candidatus Nanopelagicales bacterium]|nr:thiamine pyrophosphate-binding protein [Candidatus Nanopelagicales bacterium]
MSSPETTTVADVLLDQLADHGVTVAFGIPGVHNLPLWVGAGVGRRPRVVGVRHEQAAGYAADALARATGRLGAVLTTTGPGFVNALAAFGEAWTSFSPVVLLSSEAPAMPRRRSGYDDGLLHGMRSQAEMVRAGFGAEAVSTTTAVEAVAALPGLCAHALRTGRPVYLGVPADVLHEPWDGPVPGPLPIERARPSAPDVAAAAESLRGRRVVLWLGARAVAAEAEVLRLAQVLDAHVVTTYQARGLLAQYAGSIVAPPHEPAVAAHIAAADVLLVIGDDLAGMTTRNWRMPVPPSIVAVVDDAGLSLGDYDLAAKVVGDIATSTAAIVDALGASAGTGAGGATAADELTGSILASIAADPRTAAAATFVRTVQESWPSDGQVVVDMCIAGYWTGGYSRQPRARRLTYPVGWGTLGFGFPASIGPAAVGLETLAIVGDGGFAMGPGELATLVQEQLPAVVLLVTDGGYGMLRFDQTVAGDEHRGVDLVEPHYEDLGAAYGVPVLRTDDPGEGLAKALAEARAVDGPAMVVLEAAFHPPRTTSPRWNEA